MENQELDYTIGCIQDLLQLINRTDLLIKTHQEAGASALVIVQYQDKKQAYALELWQHLQTFNLPLQLME
ncbi:MAG: hypothetical protein EAZ95_13295 [Bacteroidetes bacterium]|nr:MAG: hypothetical protein EAZ95_13295 [Bacteroidota bacterium]